VRSGLGLAGVVVVVAACASVASPTVPPSPTDGPIAIQTFHMTGATCSLLPTRGTLVTDPIWGLALMGTDGSGAPHRYGVYWPDVYSARWEHGTAVLLDASGYLVARAGDRVVLDGERQDPFYTCADVSVESPSPTT
jgi:hypothetical protein